jgi:hypothetical protein
MHEMKDSEHIKNIVSTCTNGVDSLQLNPQIIVTSTSWSDRMRQLMKLSCSPIVVIGSFTEAAIYANCQFTVKEKKFDRLVQVLGNWTIKTNWCTPSGCWRPLDANSSQSRRK